jgi:hypothetical protein
MQPFVKHVMGLVVGTKALSETLATTRNTPQIGRRYFDSCFRSRSANSVGER